jgi:rod shape determining protein RodA
MLIWAGIPQLVLFVLVSPLIAFFLLHHPILWIGFLVLSVVIFWRSRLSVVLLLLFLLFHIGVHLGAPAAISTLHPYQQARIEAFYHPGADPSGTGYQVLQSRIAIGSGEAFGKGYLQGSQKALSFLPQQHTDFIFSVLGEEWGFAGAALVIVLFGILVLRGIHVAKTCRSPFGSLLLVGLSGLIFYHAAVNVAMTMGLFPVTGLPLPLMSYGGSFLLTMLAGLGQMVNASVHRYEY